MKVFDLGCIDGHRFEGWFRSAEDFAEQCRLRQLRCPVCDRDAVERLPSASRLNLGSHAHAGRRSGDPSGDELPGPHDALAAKRPPTPEGLVRAIAREILRTTQDVGERFVDEARRMHRGEAPARAIRGSASAEQASALIDEGVPIAPIPFPLDGGALH